MFERLRAAALTTVVRMLAGKEAFDLFNTTARRRPTLNLSSQNQDLDLGNKDDLVSGVRHMSRVFGLVRKILRTFANHVVGSCEVNFTTGNEAWDTAAEDRWREHMKTLDLSGRFHFRTLARLAVISMARDGDVGTVKTRAFGLRQIALVESDRIRNDASLQDFDLPGSGWTGGVKVDAAGRFSRFKVWDRDETPGGGFKRPREISSRDMFLLMDPDRIDGVRGVSWFASGGLNHLIDSKELLDSEKKAVKTTNRIALLITKALGGMPTDSLNLWGQNATSQGESNKTLWTEEIPDGVLKYLQPGEAVSSHQPNRPSATFQGFLETLIRDIAIGLELPYGLVWSMAGLTGPGVRFEIGQADRVFAEKFALMDFQFVRPLVQWCIAGDMEDGLLPFNPRWTSFDIQAPPSVTIDVGRESKADLEEQDRGISSGSDIAAKRGKNYFRQLELKAREARFALDLAENYQVPIGMISNLGAAKVAAPIAPPEPDDDDQDGQEEEVGQNNQPRRGRE